MARYTTELRNLIENGVDIFDFNYPFYDETKRAKFQEDFKHRFYFREIGVETVDRFKWEMRDVFANIFPYYNKLFEAAQIEYSVLDNYKLTETTTINRENFDKSGTVTSARGQTFDEQTTDTDYSRTANTVNTSDLVGAVNQNVIGSSETNKTGKSETDTTGKSETDTTGKETGTAAGSVKTMTEDTSTVANTSETGVESSETKTTALNGTSSNNSVEKFLDTPQGLTDLSNSKYLTTLKETDNSGTTHSEGTDRITGATNTSVEGTTTTNANGSVQTITGSNTENNTEGNSVTDTTGNSETNYSENVTGSSTTKSDEDTTVTQESETTETEKADTVTNFNGEQRTTNDSNTRTESKGSQSETLQTIRSGNIGVDTDSDMIHKHIKLQQILMNIQNMFFDECEVLFMGVY